MTETARKHNTNNQTYALVTAAYNEDKYVDQVLKSVVAQTVPPEKWVIVSDGSTDRTDAIVRRYAVLYSFIELYRVTEHHSRHFSAQVNAINIGLARLKAIRCNFIGNLDADIYLQPTYFESLLERFARNPNLGMAGGYIYEEKGGRFRSRSDNSITSVAHAVQLFRRECLELLGGYKTFSWGGADTHAEVRLRMNGWRVESISDLKAFHHRPTGKGFGFFPYNYRGGLMDFYLGTHPLFEVFRMARRMSKGNIVGSLVRCVGFAWAYCCGARREVSPEFIQYLRKEQMQRLWSCWSWRPAIRAKGSYIHQ